MMRCGVDVVYGVPAAKVWLRAMAEASTVLSDEDVELVWARMRRQAVFADEQEASDPPPPTLIRLYRTAAATGLAAPVAVCGMGIRLG